MKKTLCVEGWRFLPHSFSLVNMWQCLQLVEDERLQLFHHDVPFCTSEWKPHYGMFDLERERRLRRLPKANDDTKADIVYRISFPYDYSPSRAERLFVFGTSEFENITYIMLKGQFWFDSNTKVITPSQWSREGFLRSGVPDDSVVVVPHGVEPAFFRPLSAEERTALRKTKGWHDRFCFLHIGVMTQNKGMEVLLKAFSRICAKYSGVTLVLRFLTQICARKQAWVNLPCSDIGSEYSSLPI